MELIRLIKSHPMSSGQIAFHPRETYLLASGGRSVGGIQIWDVDTGTLHRKLEVVSDTFHALSFDRAGTLLAAGDGQGRITLWDTQSWAVYRVITTGQGRVFRVEVRSSGDLVASSNFTDETLRLWDIKSGKMILGLEFGIFAFHPFKPIVAVARERQFKLYDFGIGEFIKAIQLDDAITTGLTYSPDGKYLASETESEKICLYDAEDLSPRIIDGTSVFQHPVFSPNGKSIAAAYSGASTLIAMWDVETGVQVDEGKSDQPLDTPESLAFSADGSLIACSYGWRFGGNIVIWRL